VRTLNKIAVTSFLLLATVVAGTTLASAGEDEDHRQVQLGLSDLPEVHPERFPSQGPAPVPMPELPQLRLEVTGLGGVTILDVQPFDAHGAPRAEAFAEIAHAFRAASGEEAQIDPRLVEVLMSISQYFDGKPLHLVSAHRIQGRGTSKTSYHTKGMAADVAVRGEKVHDVRKAAVAAGAWGVGVYPSFVHVDVRRDVPYKWVGGTYGGWRRYR
jgi:hypothetical protein